jgi:ornithine carbamoyltransferase
MTPKHFLQLNDFSREELDYVFERTRWIKERFKRHEIYQPLLDRTLAMVFEKASTRTRVSFEAGMNQLGGIAINLNRGDTQLSRGEPIEDLARVISRMVDVVMIRTFEQTIIERFAAHSRVPVINGLTNEYHPCQILADVYTYIEHRGSLQGKTVAWIGDSNNMCNTWLQAAAIFDFKVHVSTPPGYRVDVAAAGVTGAGPFESFDDPVAACRGAAWSPPMSGPAWDSKPRTRTQESLRGLDGRCRDDAGGDTGRIVHALPARASRRGSRADVLDGPQSVVWDEAENRMHAQKAAGVSRLRSGRSLGGADDRSHGRCGFEHEEKQGVLRRRARAAWLFDADWNSSSGVANVSEANVKRGTRGRSHNIQTVCHTP